VFDPGVDGAYAARPTVAGAARRTVPDQVFRHRTAQKAKTNAISTDVSPDISYVLRAADFKSAVSEVF